tara:strand:+ start:6225 stop:7244 length:1020 start_codon:yes stop_codon:yes gene_type:complete
MNRVGIVGSTGYAGLELIKILLNHKHVTINALFSRQYTGQPVLSVYPQFNVLSHLEFETFDPANISDIDILFLAVPHAYTHSFLPQLFNQGIKIIDLSADFRLNEASVFNKYYQVDHKYPDSLDRVPIGFTELNRSAIKGADVCANPGCYSTATVLGLYPLSEKKLLNGFLAIDGKSGVSGAGKSVAESRLFCEINESLAPYGANVHRHVPEMIQALGFDNLVFSPHLIPMNRGILITAYLDMPEGFSLSDIYNLYLDAYKDEPFINILPLGTFPNTKWVRNTNMCMIGFKYIDDQKKLVIFSVIDNLVKGASGQAVQNMNLMCGFDEIEGLSQLESGV